MTDHEPPPSLDQVAETIKQAHEAEDKLHDMAPFQTTLDDANRPNTFSPTDSPELEESDS